MDLALLAFFLRKVPRGCPGQRGGSRLKEVAEEKGRFSKAL